MRTIRLLIIGLLFASGPLYGMSLGVGLSSAHAGRPVAALHAGVPLGKMMLTAITAGVATEAYYHSAYQSNLLFWQKWGSPFYGDVYGGFGVGAFYMKKALLVGEEEVEDIDQGYGPAFRVEARLFSTLFFAVEFTMALGPATVAGGWGQMGTMSLGILL